MLVATHNLMHGLRLERLLPGYVALRDRVGLDVLCVQEDGSNGELRRSTLIARALGPEYEVASSPDLDALAIVYHRGRVTCTGLTVVPLPRLAKLSWFEKLYIVGGKTRQKFALLAEFCPDNGAGFAVANFHLDTAGDNRHRGEQIRAIADALATRGHGERFAACGDTNGFALRGQWQHLQDLLAPLAALGASDPGTTPTHWFGRQNEPKLTHKTGVLLGKLGLDLPRRYDVVCTNLVAEERGQVSTEDSDHDLVWARVALP